MCTALYFGVYIVQLTREKYRVYSEFSITKYYNIENYLSSIAQSTGQYFLILPSCRSNTENQLFHYWSPGRSMLEL